MEGQREHRGGVSGSPQQFCFQEEKGGEAVTGGEKRRKERKQHWEAAWTWEEPLGVWQNLVCTYLHRDVGGKPGQVVCLSAESGKAVKREMVVGCLPFSSRPLYLWKRGWIGEGAKQAWKQ